MLPVGPRLCLCPEPLHANLYKLQGIACLVLSLCTPPLELGAKNAKPDFALHYLCDLEPVAKHLWMCRRFLINEIWAVTEGTSRNVLKW